MDGEVLDKIFYGAKARVRKVGSRVAEQDPIPGVFGLHLIARDRFQKLERREKTYENEEEVLAEQTARNKLLR